MLELGIKAPDFELPDQNGEVHKLSDYLGNIPSNSVSNLLSIYISINFYILGQFCDLGVP